MTESYRRICWNCEFLSEDSICGNPKSPISGKWVQSLFISCEKYKQRPGLFVAVGKAKKKEGGA